jgi:DNA-binding GntR family transcriptional regulator
MSREPILNPDGVKKLPRVKSRSDQIHGIIKSQIASGHLQPGVWLRQPDLADELGVGISTLREALKRLVAEGLVETEPYQGFRVIIPTPAFKEDIGDVINILEQRACELAATRITTDDLARMRELLPLMIPDAGYRDVRDMMAADREFHAIIHRATGRPVLIQLLEQVWDRYHVSEMQHYTGEDWLRFSEIQSAYSELVDALETGDGQLAREIVSRLWDEDIALDGKVFTRFSQQRSS